MIKGKKVLGVIVARGGSIRLPKKNLLKIGSNTLLEHTIIEAKKSKFIDNVICSTDDEDIKTNALENECPVPFLRPKYLASHKAKTKDLIEYISKKVDYHDYLIILQPTSPLRISKDIDNALTLCHKMNAYSVVSVTEKSKDRKLLYDVNKKHKLLDPFVKTKNNETRKLFILNGAIYILRFKNILKGLSIINKNSLAYEMPFERSIDIDTKLDLEIARLIYKGKHLL